MSEVLNTSFLGDTLYKVQDQVDSKVMIDVDHVTMVFNIASEKLNSLKEYAIALARHELRFKEFHALEDVSFQVKKGDVFGILGTNGSGKSTMLKVVAGVLTPTKGSCTVNGKIAPLIELGAGFDMDLTARENVFLNGALLGYPKKFIEDHFDEIVEFAEVEEFLDMPLKNYSSGMVARIAFAIATAVVPEILIVDEVLSVGDFMFQQKCERRIQDLIKNHGVTVLIVSHNNDQIERLCNKAIWIEKGHTRMIGPAKDVCSAYRVVGGRGGTPDAEHKIIDVMNLPLDDAAEYYQALDNDNRYSTAVNMADAYIGDQKIMELVASDEPGDCFLATSLAGHLDAVLLSSPHEDLPLIAKQTIKRIVPEQVLLFGDQYALFPKVESSVKKLNVESTYRFDCGNRADMAHAVYEYGKEHGGDWGSTAVVAFKEAQAGLVTLLPYIYSNNVPVFFADDNDETNKRTIDAVSGNFERVIVVEQGRELPQLLLEGLDACGAQIVKLENEDALALNKITNEWIEAQRTEAGLEPVDKLILCTPYQPIDAFVAGPYAAAINALIVMEDPGILDSTSATLKYIEDRAGGIDDLVFLGGKSRFSNDDRKVLTKKMLEVRGMLNENGLVEDEDSRTEDEPESPNDSPEKPQGE